MAKRKRVRRRIAARRDENGRYCSRNEIVLVWDKDLKQFVARFDDDRGTPERQAQMGGVDVVHRQVDAGGRVMRRGAEAKGENVLTLMANMGFLGLRSDKEHDVRRRLDAGLRLRTLWMKSGLSASLGNTLREKLHTGMGGDRIAEDEAAFRRLQAALSRLPPHAQSRLINLVCYDQPPPTHKFPDIIASLDELVDHWGL